jgi:hypothetical protein
MAALSVERARLGKKVALFEGGAELGVGGYAVGDQDVFGVELFGCEDGTVDQVADHGVLKFADQGQGLRRAKWEELVEFAFAAGQGCLSGEDFGAVFAVFADVVEDGGFEAAETEVDRVAAGFGGDKFYWG